MEAQIKKWLESWTGGNADKLLTYYHPEIFYRDPAHPEGIKGKENLKKYLDRLLARYPDWKWEMVYLDEAGNGRYYLKWKASILDFEEEGLDLIVIHDNQIIRNEVYFNPTRMLKRND